MGNITNTGFVQTTQNQYFTQERDRYLAIDPDWNLDPSTPDGLKLASDAEIWANLDELAQAAYNSKDPIKARGLDADLIAAITGTLRSQGTHGNVTLTLGGVAGTLVNAGAVVENVVNGSRWLTDGPVTIGAGGTIVVTATAQNIGRVQSAIGEITKIVNTVGGWQTVTNTAVPTLGTAVQNDVQLMLERERTVGRVGSNQIESILGAVFALADIRHARIYENEEDTTDANGLTRHSLAVLVEGGNDDAIAAAICSKRGTGVTQLTPGTPVTKTVTSIKYPNQETVIKFSRPVAVDAVMVVSIANDGSLPSNAAQLIKDAVLAYAQGDLGLSGNEFNKTGFTIAEAVPHSRMYTPVNSVIGQYGASSVTALTLNGSASTPIAVAFNKISRWSDSNITVNIT